MRVYIDKLGKGIFGVNDIYYYFTILLVPITFSLNERVNSIPLEIPR